MAKKNNKSAKKARHLALLEAEKKEEQEREEKRAKNAVRFTTFTLFPQLLLTSRRSEKSASKRPCQWTLQTTSPCQPRGDDFCPEK
jgi:hypothetical protein